MLQFELRSWELEQTEPHQCWVQPSLNNPSIACANLRRSVLKEILDLYIWLEDCRLLMLSFKIKANFQNFLSLIFNAYIFTDRSISHFLRHLHCQTNERRKRIIPGLPSNVWACALDAHSSLISRCAACNACDKISRLRFQSFSVEKPDEEEPERREIGREDSGSKLVSQLVFGDKLYW